MFSCYNVIMIKKTRRAFTLVELLVVTSIIGLMSTIATVNFTSARMKARDARRWADMDVMRTALELYFDSKDSYPVDKHPGADGLVLGKAGAISLSVRGFTDQETENVFLMRVPANPAGGGADYVYYSLDQDGKPCDAEPCAGFNIEFVQEAKANDHPPGAYYSNAVRTLPVPPQQAARVLARADQTTIERVAAETSPFIDSGISAFYEVKHATADNPTVQQVASDVVAPVTTAAVAVSTVTGVGSAAQTVATTTATAASGVSAFGQMGALFYLLFTQPFLLLRKRKEYAWGVVYDSQKKLPVDLAIVRLIDNATDRVVQTRVTDKEGRIFFFVSKGSYRLEASKPTYKFPSAVLAGDTEDGKYANLYFGQKFTVSGAGQVVNPSIPLDPAGSDASDREFIKRFFRGKTRYAISVLGLLLNAAVLVITPTYVTAGMMTFNLVAFLVFRRLAYPKQPPEWGVVKDEKTGHPIGHAVVRLFSAPYDKLVETRVADGRGRYNFVVGKNIFYLTATSQGYWKTESYPLDLRSADKAQIISAPIIMRSAKDEAQPRVFDGRSAPVEEKPGKNIKISP